MSGHQLKLDSLSSGSDEKKQSKQLTQIKPLGSGAAGTVFQGLWGGRIVAFKKFNVSYRTEAIKVEIELAKSLRDCHIIQFYEDGYFEDRLVLIMEYAEGGSLKSAIDHGQLDWPIKIRIANQMARGLQFMHSRMVVHRDLKSANVLLTRNLDAKLCDFGLSEIRAASMGAQSTDVFRGTVRWMAPELFTTRPRYSSKSDVYALGMVMWEMAADCTQPFRAQLNDGAIGYLVAVDRKREDIPENTPIEYQQWIEKCWFHDPNERPEAERVVLVSQEYENTENRNDTANFLTLSCGPSRRGYDTHIYSTDSQPNDDPIYQEMAISAPSSTNSGPVVESQYPYALFSEPVEDSWWQSVSTSELMTWAAQGNMEAQQALARRHKLGQSGGGKFLFAGGDP